MFEEGCYLGGDDVALEVEGQQVVGGLEGSMPHVLAGDLGRDDLRADVGCGVIAPGVQHQERHLDGIEAAEPDLHPVKCKRLESLLRHEEGLRVFVDNPAVAMDNNCAERTLRPMVLARQLFYGCQSAASAQLLAQLRSIFATLMQQDVAIRPWLDDYLRACALAGGQAPPQAADFLLQHLPPHDTNRMQRSA